MSIEQEVEILRRIPLFANVEPAKLKLMCFASERITYKSGQSLFEQGDIGDAAFIIIEGTADVIVNRDGPMVVAQLGKDDIVGEIAILVDIPRTAAVTEAVRGISTSSARSRSWSIFRAPPRSPRPAN